MLWGNLIMAHFICEFKGVRGRILKLYDTKLVIITKKNIGSFITGNITDGEKTIFMSDIVGIQFKKSGFLIGYLQFETPSLQMNNKSDNMFSENTFTFEVGKNGITNELIEALYNFVVDRIEEIKYGTNLIKEVPNFESMKKYSTHRQDNKENVEEDIDEDVDEDVDEKKFNHEGENIDFGTYDDISDFKEEIRRTSTEDLKLILEDQLELYSDDEIAIIIEELQSRS